ncbi:MAG: radical SAM protein [Spirochaetales bacterium]|nr:radical SAM protein [Spirochaetales bacterium]
MIQYKIREEKNGAMLFDNRKGAVTVLTEEQYQAVIHNRDPEFRYLHDAEGMPLYRVFRSGSPREQLPVDCLSAPSKVYFEITRKCNLLCKHCYNRSRINFPGEIKKEILFAIIDELELYGTFEIRLTGGEPTLHPDFFEILDYLTDRDFFISLGTNGVWDDELIQRIISSDIKTVIISLDGPVEFNDRVRGKGTYAAVTRTIDQLKRKGKMNLKMNSVLCKENLHYIDEIIDLSGQLGFDGLNIAPLRTAGRAEVLHHLSPLDSSDMYSIVSRITEQRRKKKIKIQTYFDILKSPDPVNKFPSSILNNKSCAAGIEVAAVSPFGEIYGCVVSPANTMSDNNGKKLFVAGNINEGRFIDVWLDSSRWKAYRDLALNKSTECLHCDYYSVTCFGNCVVDSYMQDGTLNSPSPLCFRDMVRKK